MGPENGPAITPIASQPTVGRSQRTTILPRRFDNSIIDLPGRPDRHLLLANIKLVQLPTTNSSEVPRFELGDTEVRYIQRSLNFAIQKLREYVSLMEAYPAYWSAFILHPCYRSRLICDLNKLGISRRCLGRSLRITTLTMILKTSSFHNSRANAFVRKSTLSLSTISISFLPLPPYGMKSTTTSPSTFNRLVMPQLGG